MRIGHMFLTLYLLSLYICVSSVAKKLSLDKIKQLKELSSFFFALNLVLLKLVTIK